MSGAFRVAILGAGISGLAMGIRLRESGVESFVILEKAERVGGTWRENTYPGVACDVPSHLYSYSFAPNPDWSRVFSPGGEIWRYCEDTAAERGLAEHLRFGAEVRSLRYENKRWCIDLGSGEQIVAEVVVSALGGLHIPNVPDFPGLDSFRGAFFHSARWEHDREFRDKQVAVIGSGASAVQIVPELAKRAAQVTVFQRTPGWVVPRLDAAYSDGAKRRFRRFPSLQRLHRWFFYWLLEVRGRFVRKNTFMGRVLRKQALGFLRRQIADPELREALTPDYAIGCKRILVSDDYFSTLSQKHVALTTCPIRRFTATGIECEDGTHHELDVAVAATGFRPFDIAGYVDVVGRDGLRLADLWRDRVEAHRTTMVPGFPNFFLLLGPNSGLGHNSVILMIEAQVEYILGCLSLMDEHGKQRIEALPEACERFNNELRRGMQRTVFAGGCNAWYTDSQDHNFTLWPYSTLRYFWDLRRPKRAEFRLDS